MQNKSYLYYSYKFWNNIYMKLSFLTSVKFIVHYFGIYLYFTVSLHTGWKKSSHQVWNIFFIYLYSILIFCSNIVFYIFIFYFYPIYTIFLYVLTIDILFIHLNKNSKLSIFNVVCLNVIIFFIDFFFILLSFFAYNSCV